MKWPARASRSSNTGSPSTDAARAGDARVYARLEDLVALRHLRYFLDPVPAWVWGLQLPGLIAGYVLPVSLVYILAVRIFSEREKYSSPANVLLLALLLAISGIGVLKPAAEAMSATWSRPAKFPTLTDMVLRERMRP